MPHAVTSSARQRRRYQRACLRHLLFTAGPNRLTNGRLIRRHLARHELVVRDLHLTSPHWPHAFDGLRIAHVSDFHLGELMPLDHALRIVRHIAQSAPDLVACTGDVVDLHHDEAPSLFAALAGLNAPMGALLVLGNHDELHCREEITSMARAAGVTVLRDQRITIPRNGHANDAPQLRVAGLNWAPTQRACTHAIRALAQAPVDLLLSHNPRAFRTARRRQIPLTLAGHTHGGQVAIRNRPQANLAFTHRRSVGHHEADGCHLYITAGVGAWFPLRINCPPEIAVITMRYGTPASATLATH
jgi:predicted MPP superfamily phosphohydrolase